MQFFVSMFGKSNPNITNDYTKNINKKFGNYNNDLSLLLGAKILESVSSLAIRTPSRIFLMDKSPLKTTGVMRKDRFIRFVKNSDSNL